LMAAYNLTARDLRGQLSTPSPSGDHTPLERKAIRWSIHILRARRCDAGSSLHWSAASYVAVRCLRAAAHRGAANWRADEFSIGRVRRAGPRRRVYAGIA